MRNKTYVNNMVRTINDLSRDCALMDYVLVEEGKKEFVKKIDINFIAFQVDQNIAMKQMQQFQSQ